jgi:hypothetical protein
MTMTVVAYCIIIPLFFNAVVAFFVAFFWQAKVILSIYRLSDWRNSFVPWTALSNQNSPQNLYGRFIAGELLPELRSQWLKAVTYVAISYFLFFVAAGIIELFAPEIIS